MKAIIKQHLTKIFILLLLCGCALRGHSTYLFIPMDLTQKNHLKAYGIAYFAVSKEIDVSWLLNYRGGSFMLPYNADVADECSIRGVTYENISDLQGSQILADIASLENNRNHNLE